MATVLKEDRFRQAGISEAEWKVRVDLAAFYRLSALYGWDDFLYTHISARVPGPDHHFLINPFGLLYDEVTASNLVKIDVEGNNVGGSPYMVNKAGFTQHAYFHKTLGERAHAIAVSATPLPKLALSRAVSMSADHPSASAT